MIAPEYFLEKALAPFAEVTVPGQGALADAFKAAIETRPTAILVADVGRLGEGEAAAHDAVARLQVVQVAGVHGVSP